MRKKIKITVLRTEYDQELAEQYAYLQAVGVINSHESGCFLNPLQQ